LKLIYNARDITEAHIVSGLLKSNGIDAYVGGHYLQGGVGELAASDFATIHVDDENVDAALSIIAEYEGVEPQRSEDTKQIRCYLASPLIVLIVSILLMLLLAIAFAE
jgi:hypothetical protein